MLTTNNSEEWSDLLLKPYRALLNRRRLEVYRSKVASSVDPVDWAFKLVKGVRIQEEMRRRFADSDARVVPQIEALDLRGLHRWLKVV